MTTPEALLQLQQTDSAIDQIRHRMPKLPEVVASEAATAAVTAWKKRTLALRAEIERLESSIGESEATGATITKQINRLEQQLKTVISPREAEALMHEIELIRGKRSAQDDEELEAMDALGTAESSLTEHRATEDAIRAEAAAAAEAASGAVVVSEAELSAKTAQREQMRNDLPADALRTYDTMRSQHSGVAIAKLNGLQCSACHLDLSRGEVDNIKRLGPEELPECPNCGRLLVR